MYLIWKRLLGVGGCLMFLFGVFGMWEYQSYDITPFMSDVVNEGRMNDRIVGMLWSGFLSTNGLLLCIANRRPPHLEEKEGFNA